LPQQSGDFGQTLYVWGVRKSPYLFLPVIGPTNVRDLFGTTLEFAATIPAGNLLPSQIASTVNGVTMAGTIATPFTELDDVADMRDLEENSLDFYVMLRSVVEQKRQAELEEALRTSGWTAARYRSDSSGVTPATEVEALAPTPAPQTPSQEFMVGAFRGANG
jgi:phospholipid-binding lipoprotein MlaA